MKSLLNCKKFKMSNKKKHYPLIPKILKPQNLTYQILSLLSHSVELQKANLQESDGNALNGSSLGAADLSGTSSDNAATATATASTLASALPLAQLLAKPGALNALTSLSALGGLTDLLGGLANLAPAIQTTGIHRNKSFAPRMRSPNNHSNNDNNKRNERSKFNPY